MVVFSLGSENIFACVEDRAVKHKTKISAALWGKDTVNPGHFTTWLKGTNTNLRKFAFT